MVVSKVGIAVFALLLLLSLTACVGVLEREEFRAKAVLSHEVMGDKHTVAFDARESVGRDLGFYWSFGEDDDGDRWGGMVERYTYAQKGVYVAILTVVEGEGDQWNVGTLSRGGRQPGQEPLPEEVKDSAYVVVDLLEEGVSAAILALRNNKPALSFYAWDSPTFYAGHSATDDPGGLWFQWKAERRYRPLSRGDWISGEGWEVIVGPWTTWEEMDRYQGETWSPGHNFFRVPGSDFTEKPLEMIQYRITLTVTDAYGRQGTESIILTVYTGC